MSTDKKQRGHKPLTPKQEKFCEYVASGKTYKDAYLLAYDCTSEKTACVESSGLALRSDIQERVSTLLKPIVEAQQKSAISERQRKKEWLWNMVETAKNDSDRLRAMDILNRMDSEYREAPTVEEKDESVQNIDTGTLIKLVSNE